MRFLAVLLALSAVLTDQSNQLPSLSRSAQLRQLETQERQIRGLTQLHPVKATFLGPRAFKALITAQLKRDDPPSEIAIGQRELVEIGFLNPGQSYRKIVFSGLSAQPIGLYDDTTRTLYVRNQNGQAFKLERYVIVHEYTHALQDQHWNLRRVLPDDLKQTYRNSDALVAHRALVEGDAVTTQTIYINRSYTPAEFKAMIAYESKLSSGTKLPWAVSKDFYFPYTTGVQFVQTLLAKGGMTGINSAFSRLPSSTYEIMFPSAYLSGWKPVAVTLHRVAGFGGWKQVDDDVFGAFEYELLLAQGGSQARADSVVRTYRGDRYVFLEKGKSNLLLMLSRWSTPAAAQQARAAVARSLEQRFGSGATWNDSRTMLTTPGVSVSLQVRGSLLRLVYAPTASIARRAAVARTS